MTETKKKRLRIKLDMDSILANFLKKVLDTYNAEYGDNKTIDEMKGYKLSETLPFGDKIYEYFARPGFYRDLEPLPGALEAARTLHDAGHEVGIVTSPGSVTACIPDKGAWLDEHLPFLNMRKRIYTSDKGSVDCDILVDDGPEYIEAWHRRQAKRDKRKRLITIAYPYNTHLADLCHLRAESYKDTAAAWKQIVAYIDDVAHGRQA